ncbi:MAG: ABC transporter ATP-binding protein, partial [Lachnospiraceae bacterium]
MKDRKQKNYAGSDLSVFISYIIPHRKLFAIDMLLSTLIAGIDLAFPYITRKAMNNLLPQKMYLMFFVVMGIVLAAYILRALIQYLV